MSREPTMTPLFPYTTLFRSETAIYRIIQEAMTNTRKYAETSELFITIRERDESVRVMIKDEGKGFDMAKVTRNVGLFSMEERAPAVGGEIIISSKPGSGTTIILDIPVRSEEHT